jgi:hypothetical protein
VCCTQSTKGYVHCCCVCARPTLTSSATVVEAAISMKKMAKGAAIALWRWTRSEESIAVGLGEVMALEGMQSQGLSILLKPAGIYTQKRSAFITPPWQ